ncbi:MAG: ubiquitin-like domain-containing protein [Acidimicrobiales bacterium]
MVNARPVATESTTADDIEPLPDVVVGPSRPPTTGIPPATGRRYGPLIAVAVALLVLVGGAVLYYLTREINVEVTIDGQAQSVETRAATVADLLAGQGVDVTDQDRVVPGLDAELAEGDSIEISFARPLSVTIDGVEVEHTTTELSLGDALGELDAPIDGAAISVSLDYVLPRSGAAVEIVTPKPVNLTVGGEPRSATSTARTVEELLETENLTVADDDTLDPAPDTTVTADMTVTITRIRTENEVRIEPIPHETVERNDAELTAGVRETVTAGVDGEQEVTYAVTYTNGEVTDTVEVTAAVTSEPVTEVIRNGTKPAPAPAAVNPGSAGGDAASLNWSALAQCESSGNPRAVNPAGYYGLYQFSLATWASVGGSGNPADASVAEQTNRAHILYNRSGAGQWPTCGRLLFQ